MQHVLEARPVRSACGLDLGHGAHDVDKVRVAVFLEEEDRREGPLASVAVADLVFGAGTVGRLHRRGFVEVTGRVCGRVAEFTALAPARMARDALFTPPQLTEALGRERVAALVVEGALHQDQNDGVRGDAPRAPGGDEVKVRL